MLLFTVDISKTYGIEACDVEAWDIETWGIETLRRGALKHGALMRGNNPQRVDGVGHSK